MKTVQNIEKFIADKIKNGEKGTFSAMAIRIATASVALVLIVMIVSVAILEGFKYNIRAKLFSFGGHVQLLKYSLNESTELEPIPSKDINKYLKIKGVNHVQTFCIKTGLLKTNHDVQGVIIKGIDKNFSTSSFKSNLVEGTTLQLSDTISNDILISKKLADKLQLKLNDKFIIYFIQNPPRFRKLSIVGIYNTGMEEFDEYFLIGDARLIQKLNNWKSDMVGGIELWVDDISNLDAISESIYDAMPMEMQLEKITDKHSQVFDWLSLLDRNVIIFSVLVLIVACINIISTVIIMMMERTGMIGLLKALGATNWQIVKIFTYNGLRIISKGMILGNIFGLSLCAAQYFFNIIPLDSENYYMSHVPIYWDWTFIISLNTSILLLVLLLMSIPLMIVPRIRPIRSIKFD